MHISDLKVQDNKGKYQNSRIYIFPKGENILQNIENRKQRPYTVYRKELIPAILESVKLPKGTKVRWSQYAGCSCPCSPGFIIEGSMNKDIFVTVEIKEPETV
jgi:hypothetical protein